MMSQDEKNNKLGSFLNETKPLFEELVAQAGSGNDRPYAKAEFSSYEEFSKMVKEVSGLIHCGKEQLKRTIIRFDQSGIIEIEEFDKQSGYLRCKMFLPTSDFNEMKN